MRLGSHIPLPAEMGYHLCYGDAGHKHFKEPEDTGKLVEIANAISAGITRPINWIHLPVPQHRSDAAYYAPLGNLHLHPETELYLGLVHFTDGVEGTLKRIKAAKQFVTDFGVPPSADLAADHRTPFPHCCASRARSLSLSEGGLRQGNQWSKTPYSLIY